MNFLRRGSSSTAEKPPAGSGERSDGREVVTVGGDAAGDGVRRDPSPGKGRPTPSRRQAEGRKRGPIAPAPKTQREAFRRAKEQRGSKQDRRRATDDRRKRMLAGDDRVLMPRDRGPARAYARDLVDGRRNLMGLFMPMAVLIFVTVVVPVPTLQSIGSIVCVAMLAAMVIEGVLLGRYVVGRVRWKFPDDEVKGFSFGWYAFTRATQIRKLRMPAPRVARGTQVD